MSASSVREQPGGLGEKGLPLKEKLASCLPPAAAADADDKCLSIFNEPTNAVAAALAPEPDRDAVRAYLDMLREDCAALTIRGFFADLEKSCEKAVEEARSNPMPIRAYFEEQHAMPWWALADPKRTSKTLFAKYLLAELIKYLHEQNKEEEKALSPAERDILESAKANASSSIEHFVEEAKSYSKKAAKDSQATPTEAGMIENAFINNGIKYMLEELAKNIPELVPTTWAIDIPKRKAVDAPEATDIKAAEGAQQKRSRLDKAAARNDS